MKLPIAEGVGVAGRLESLTLEVRVWSRVRVRVRARVRAD